MGGRLDFTAKFRDLQVMEDVKKKAELGWMEMEFTVYGAAYLENDEMCYKLSTDAGKIYQFIEEASFSGVYAGDIMTATYKRLVPIGMKDEILLDVKKQLAYQLYKAYPRELFTSLSKIADEIRDDSAYAWLDSEREKLEGVFDEKKLNYFRKLVKYCYSLCRLSEIHYRELLSWIDMEEKCMEDSFVTKDVFEKTFYGVAYHDGERYKYIEDSVPEYIYRQKRELEGKGIFCSNIFSETLWYNYTFVLKDCRKAFTQLFRENMNQEYLDTLAAICQNKRYINSDLYEHCLVGLTAPAQDTLAYYLQKWNIDKK